MTKKIKKSIFLPDSLLENEPTLFLKTLKIGNLMRAMSIFSVDEIFFYSDEADSFDIEILKKNIKYLLIPPQLRRFVPKDKCLQFSGILPPIPLDNSTQKDKNRKILGVVINSSKNHDQKNNFRLKIKLENSKVINNNFISNSNLNPKKGDLMLLDPNGEIDRLVMLDDFSIQNNVKINFLDQNLPRWIEKFNSSKALNIICSRYGHSINFSRMNEISKKIKKFEDLRLMYGPIKGSFIEYLRKRKLDLIQYSVNMEIINFFPEQGTATIKIEEAILGSLSIINTIMLG